MTAHHNNLLFSVILALAGSLSVSTLCFAESCPVTLRTISEALHRQYPKLEASPPVALEQIRRLRNPDARPRLQPADRIADWLRVIERTHGSARKSDATRRRLREFYHRNYVIEAANVPESYFNLQRRIAREQGRGNITITSEVRKQLIETLIADQKASLDEWIDYFISSDTDAYPFAAKYWAFSEMVKMAPFDAESGQFLKRSKGTTTLFPNLNREALSKVVEERVRNPSSESFALLYGNEARRLRDLALQSTADRTATEGVWIRYPQGSDPTPLVNSIKDRNTGWCTVGIETARHQLNGGDFHVFYTRDTDGNPTVPRIAIRMEGERIGEVRGIAAKQHLDPHMTGAPVLRQKLETFGSEGTRYERASSHMAQLTALEKKMAQGEAPTREELRFLYELDSKIEGFGYDRDPRVAEILASRDKRNDLAYVLGVEPHRISFTQEEALSGNIAFHFGDLDLSDFDLHSIQGQTLPQSMQGNLDLSRVTTSQGLTLPTSFKGQLYLRLTSAQGLTLPSSFEGHLALYGLTSAQGLTFPTSFKGDLDLNSLTSTEGLTLPPSFKGQLYLRGLRSAHRLTFPTSFEGTLDLGSLSLAYRVTLPSSFKGTLNLSNLTTVDGLTFPSSFEGLLYLGSLTSAQNVTIPPHFEGFLDLHSLKSAEGLTLPSSFKGTLHLNNLTSAKGLTLPSSFKGTLNLSYMRSVQGLTLPSSFEGILDLSLLNSLNGILWPTSFSGTIRIHSRQLLDQMPPHLRALAKVGHWAD